MPGSPKEVTYFTLMAGSRSTPGVILLSLGNEFQWSRATVSSIVSINIFLHGLIGPFAAALYQFFGLRRTMMAAMALLTLGYGLSAVAKQVWKSVVLWLIEEGALVDHLSDRYEQSPLFFAVSSGDGALVEYLISVGADVNRCIYANGAPLGQAILRKDLAVVTRLLDAGASPNLVCYDEASRRMTTPLALAERLGQNEIRGLLLARGANPRAQLYLQESGKR